MCCPRVRALGGVRLALQQESGVLRVAVRGKMTGAKSGPRQVGVCSLRYGRTGAIVILDACGQAVLT
jgi:hypothetical protein